MKMDQIFTLHIRLLNLLIYSSSLWWFSLRSVSPQPLVQTNTHYNLWDAAALTVASNYGVIVGIEAVNLDISALSDWQCTNKYHPHFNSTWFIYKCNPWSVHSSRSRKLHWSWSFWTSLQESEDWSHFISVQGKGQKQEQGL